MNLPRRQFLHLAAGAFAAPAIARHAVADAYPSRPVRLIVGFTPAGGNDIIARLMGQWLTSGWARRSSSRTALARAPTSRPSGDQFTPRRLHAVRHQSLERDQRHPLRKTQLRLHARHAAGRRHRPGAGGVRDQLFGSGEDVTEFIAHAKANPGRINMGSAGIGSTGHLAGELFKMMAGVNMIHVPYRGNAPALTDLIAGRIEVLFPSLGSSIEYVKTGRLRALAVTDATRSDALPDLPTVAETLPGYQAPRSMGSARPAIPRPRSSRF
jgi:Uncharacterized protein conserved in bacteria